MKTTGLLPPLMADPRARRDHPAAGLPGERQHNSDVLKYSARLIRFRWLAGAALLIWTLLSGRLLAPPQLPALLGLNAGILLYNSALWGMLRTSAAGYQKLLTYLQVGMDWLALMLLVHLTGGVESAILPFFMFYVLLATLLLSERDSYLFIGIVILSAVTLSGAEGLGLLPHHALTSGANPDLYRSPWFIGGKLATFSLILIGLGAIMIPSVQEFRRREGHLAALYDNIQSFSRSLDLPHILNLLTLSATQALQADAAAIRLIRGVEDPQGFSASYGISASFAGELAEIVTLTDSAALSSSSRVTRIDDLPDRFAANEAARLLAEGIGSFLCVPLAGHGGLIGVLYIFGRERNSFDEIKASMAMALAGQAATAIENAMAFAELQQNEQRRSQFVRTVTHELRSPVAGAQSLLRSLMFRAPEMTEAQREVLKRLSLRLELLQALIDDLLALAAGRLEGPDTRLEAISLEAVILDVIDRLGTHAEEKSVRIIMNYVPLGLTVLASQQGLDRVFLNLIGNAIKYTPPGGQVSIDLERQSDEVIVRVIDTGIGIPESDLPMLFDEFFRARNARETGIPGTGLGLSIARDTVERYQGRISVQSKAGEGSTFTVRLPLLPERGGF